MPQGILQGVYDEGPKILNLNLHQMLIIIATALN